MLAFLASGFQAFMGKRSRSGKYRNGHRYPSMGFPLVDAPSPAVEQPEELSHFEMP